MNQFINIHVECLRKYLEEKEIMTPKEVFNAQLIKEKSDRHLGWISTFKSQQPDINVKRNDWLEEKMDSELRGIVVMASKECFELCTNRPCQIAVGKVFTFQKMFPSETYLIQAMYDITKYKTPQKELRNILFGQKPTEVSLLQEITFINPKLDDSQKRAVRHCMYKKFTFLHGPPGTGKTLTLLEILMQCIGKGKKVLMLAPCHSAVDNILGKILQNGHEKIVRLGHPACTSFPEMCLTNRAKQLNQTEKFILHEAQVVFGTLAGSIKTLALMKSNHFPMILVDEAGLCMECLIWSVVKYSTNLILAGDFHQLGPRITSRDKNVKIVLGKSMIERLANNDTGLMQTLSIQYRMSDEIMQWSNKTFYGGNLQSASIVANINLLSLPGIRFSKLPTKRTLYLIDTNGKKGEVVCEDGKYISFYNPGESASVAKIVKNLLRSGVKQHQLGVISFYRKQIDDIESRLKIKNIEHVEVMSVDSFQGREKEVIILSMVRSNIDCNIGFLQDSKRLNVSATRARRLLIVVVDTKTFQHNEIFESFFEHLRLHGDVRIFR